MLQFARGLHDEKCSLNRDNCVLNSARKNSTHRNDRKGYATVSKVRPYQEWKDVVFSDEFNFTLKTFQER